MSKKNLTHIRIRADEKMKINDLRFKLSALQGKPVTSAEVIKRTFNIENLPKVLENDAKAKKKLKIK